MLRGLIGEGSIVSALKTGLSDSYRRIGAIGHRIANEGTPGFEDFPSYEIDGQPTGVQPVDLEVEMAALADEQIRFDAGAQLLRLNYEMIRVSMRQG